MGRVWVISADISFLLPGQYVLHCILPSNYLASTVCREILSLIYWGRGFKGVKEGRGRPGIKAVVPPLWDPPLSGLPATPVIGRRR